MKVKFSIPGKTFLVGEYVALFGGPSLVAATGPNFELIVDLKGNGDMGGIHPDSPAGRWMQKNSDVFSRVNLTFNDPFDGSGGLGASSAQFVLVHSFTMLAQSKFAEGLTGLNPHQMWKDFRALHEEDQEEWLPSGADVVAQMVGGISSFERDGFRLKKMHWPFEDLSFVVLKTGNKINTHEHLKDLGHLELDSLTEVCRRTVEALSEEDPMLFVKSVEQFYSLLKEQKLVCRETMNLVDNLKNSESTVAVKGCGALGADTLLVVCEKSKRDTVKALAPVVGLSVVADERDLSKGMEVSFDYEYSRQQQAIHSLRIKSDEVHSSAQLDL